MAYKKQNFARGQTLYASQLNAMDGQIAANEAAIKENKRAIEALPSGGGTTLTGAQAATLMAMRNAFDNAEQSALELETTINRRRQAQVTASIIETAADTLENG